MIINNFTFEETIIKQKQLKNKVALQEKLLSNSGEDIDIDNYNPITIIELIPQRITSTSQVVLTKLLNKNLSDESLRRILRLLIQWEGDKNIELSNLYILLFNHSVYEIMLCRSKSKVDDFTFNNEELIIIVNQLIEAFQHGIANNPAAIENITAWIILLVDNNRLLMPAKETNKLLELVKQYQKFQESIRNIQQLISLPPVQIKKQNVVTHVYF